MKSFLLGLALLIALAATPPAGAQEVQRIAAIVNDEVISAYDLERRVNLVMSSTGIRETPETRRRLREQVLRALIDERVQMQEAARLNVAVTDEDLDRAIAMLEQQNRVPPGRFDEFLRQQNVDRNALMQQIRAEIAWSKVIRRKLVPTIEIPDDEVQATLDRLKASQGVVESQVSEIFLNVDSPDQEDEIRRGAQRLVEQLRRGEANFPAVARQFSQGSTAASGGDVGWVQPGTLAEEVDAALAQLQPGEVSDPIRTAGGYYIVFLRERRQIAAGKPEDTRVALKQVLLPLPPDAGEQAVATQTGLARELSANIGGCEDLDRAVEEMGSRESGDLGTLRIGDLPAQFRPVVANLPIGKLSEPMRTENGLHLLMVCQRTEADSGLPSPQDVRNGLMNRRIALMSRRYMRDLRRDAVVELR